MRKSIWFEKNLWLFCTYSIRVSNVYWVKETIFTLNYSLYQHLLQELLKITKMNYLNYLKTEHIIDMMFTLHSDHQKQMRSIVDMMLMSERETIITIL